MTEGPDEIRRNELKRLVSAAIGGGIAVVGPDLPRTPTARPTPGLSRIPSKGPMPALLLDSEWCLVGHGKYLSMTEFRNQLREGPLNFAWMGTQVGPGLFQPGIGLTHGLVAESPAGDLRAASQECVADGFPLRFQPDLDRWVCERCGSAYAGRDGRVLAAPASKPLVTFSLLELEGGKRVALVPPNARPPR